MNNPYTSYYLNQVGGLPGFVGVRYQRGHGFFGRIFGGIGSFLKDLLPNLGKRALPSAINLAQDIISGENVAKSAKSRLVEAGKDIADETLSNLHSRLQRGSGIRKRHMMSPMRIHGYKANKMPKVNKRAKVNKRGKAKIKKAKR